MPQSPNPTASPRLLLTHEQEQSKGEADFSIQKQPYVAEKKHLQLGRAFGSSTIQLLVFKRNGEELRHRNNRDFG